MGRVAGYLVGMDQAHERRIEDINQPLGATLTPALVWSRRPVEQSFDLLGPRALRHHPAGDQRPAQDSAAAHQAGGPSGSRRAAAPRNRCLRNQKLSAKPIAKPVTLWPKA